MSAFTIAITAVANVFLMMFIGFGGLGESENVIVPASIYFGAVFVWLYVFLAKASKDTRTRCLVGISAPWIFVCVMAIPQLPKEPGGVSLVLGCTFLPWLLRFPGEMLATSISSRW